MKRLLGKRRISVKKSHGFIDKKGEKGERKSRFMKSLTEFLLNDLSNRN